MYKGRHRRTGSSGVLKICLFVVFGAIFITSAFIASRILLENSTAAGAYDDLRVNRQNATGNISESTTQGDTTAVTQVNVAGDETKPDSTVSAQMPVISMDFTLMQEVSPQIKAWLVAEGTTIDYPVMQADNNSYYLNHLYNGERNSSGSLFVDSRNTGLFTDRNTIIYGHHMKNGTMFGALEQYKKQSFYDEHPTMKLCTPDGDYTIELICGTVEDGNYEFVQFEFFDEDDFNLYIDSRRERSTFQSNVVVEPGDRLVSLCTCTSEWNNARYMVIGRLVPVMELIRTER